MTYRRDYTMTLHEPQLTDTNHGMSGLDLIDDAGLSLPAALAAILDAAQVPIPAGSLRALAAVAVPDQKVTAERLSRVAAYEEDAAIRSRKTPRFCWAITQDGVAPSPRIWTRGEWRFPRRVITDEAVQRWTVVLAMFLARQMAEGTEPARAELHKVALEAVARAIGPVAVYPPGSREEWADLQRRIAPLQHPLGPAGFSHEQQAAATELESHLTQYNLWFGLRDEHRLHQTEDFPPRLRLAHGDEVGTPFDEFVLSKLDDVPAFREVLAYVQEWDRLTDELGRSPSSSEYAERWRVDIETTRGREMRFRSVFPTEESPARIVRLLWSGVPSEGDFVRLLGQRVVEMDALPTVIGRFVDSLAFELRADPQLGRAVYRSAATFEARDTTPSRELRRFFALCDRAFRMWAAQALSAAGATAELQGLLSIGSVYDESTAAYAEQIIGQYRRALPAGPARRLLLAVQKVLRVGATLDALDPPPTTAPYLEGVQWAAKALAEARAPEIPIDLVEEAVAAARTLDAVH
jgi:hypothetical protein